MILHVDPEKGWGGGERQVAGLMRHLFERGHTNHLLCNLESPLVRETKNVAKEIFGFTMRNDLDFRPVPAVRRIMRSGAYDIVHFHTKRAHALSAWLGRTPSEQRRVVTRRMDYPLRGGWFDRHLYNRCVDGVVAISEPIAALLAAGGVDQKRIRVIASGVDPAPYENIPAPSGQRSPVVVGTVAALEARKGHRFLLEAAAELKRRGRSLTYRIAGDGSEKTALQDIALKLGVEREVEFVGFVSDVAGFLASIDIFVLASMFEGLGVAAIEAMAAARPVVATAVGGLKDLVVEGETGFLVPPGDPMALAQALDGLAEEKELARAMGEKGRARVLEHFTMERMARANEEFYYELLGGQAD
jgi:glycosyltransferase involved in cell wall biosynthesis